MRVFRLAAVVLAGVVALMTLAGCSGGDDAVVQGAGKHESSLRGVGRPSSSTRWLTVNRSVRCQGRKIFPDEGEVNLADYRGKVVVVNVWASVVSAVPRGSNGA